MRIFSVGLSLVVLLLMSGIQADVVGSHEVYTPDPRDTQKVCTEIVGSSRPMGGPDVTVRFDELPRPCMRCRAHVSIRCRPSEDGTTPPFDIKIAAHNRDNMILLSDSLMDREDMTVSDGVLSFDVDFMCLASGAANLEIGMLVQEGAILGSFAFAVCFDENGNLIALNRRALTDSRVQTVFFDEGTADVILLSRDDDLVAGHVVMTATEDTSEVCFKLLMQYPLPEDYRIEITYANMLVVGTPKIENKPLRAGDSLVVCLGVIPQPLSEVNSLHLSLYPPERLVGQPMGSSGEPYIRYPYKKVVSIEAVFDADGSLRFVHSSHIAGPEVLREILPHFGSTSEKKIVGSIWLERE